MGSRVCVLTAAARHSLSIVVTTLSLLLAYAGDVMVMVALYIKFLLESHLAVVLGSHGGALAYFLLAVGLVINFVSAASAKANFDAGCLEKSTQHTCNLLLFTLACQGLTLVLLVAAVIMSLVHKSLIRGVLRNGFLAAMKLYRMNDRTKAGINRIQAGYQCCGSRSMQDWFRIPWISMDYLNVDHPEVEKRIEDGDFVTDDAPYSCCNVHATRPCVHHQVQNMSAHRLMGPGGTLYTTGCVQRLEDYWKASVLSPVLGLMLLIFLLMVVSMTLSRLLQTSLQDALDKGDPAADGDAYCCRPCIIGNKDTAPEKTVKTEERSKGDGGDRPWGWSSWRLPWGARDQSHNRSANINQSHNRSANINQSHNRSANINQSGTGCGSGDSRAKGEGQDLKRTIPHTRYTLERGRGLSRGEIRGQTQGRSLSRSRTPNHSRDRSQDVRRDGSRGLSRDRFRDQKRYRPAERQAEYDRQHRSVRDGEHRRDKGRTKLKSNMKVRIEEEFKNMKTKMTKARRQLKDRLGQSNGKRHQNALP